MVEVDHFPNYPKVNLKIAAATKFAISNLKCDRHLVVDMELFVETLARVRLELDVVGGNRAEHAAQGRDGSGSGEAHFAEANWQGGKRKG